MALQDAKNQHSALKSKKEEDQDYLKFLKNEFEKESNQYKSKIGELEQIEERFLEEKRKMEEK